MSVHPSLSTRKGIKHRNVLKRYERIRAMQEKDTWPKGRSPLGLPKVRSIKFKVKKSSAAPGAEGDAAKPDATAHATDAKKAA